MKINPRKRKTKPNQSLWLTYKIISKNIWDKNRILTQINRFTDKMNYFQNLEIITNSIKKYKQYQKHKIIEKTKKNQTNKNQMTSNIQRKILILKSFEKETKLILINLNINNTVAQKINKFKRGNTNKYINPEFNMIANVQTNSQSRFQKK